MLKLNVFVLVLFLISLVGVSSITLAQEEPTDVVETVTAVEDEGNPISDFFVSLGALAGVVVVVFQFVKDKLLKQKPNQTWTQILSWLISIVLALVGYWFQWGLFEGLDIVWTLVTGFGVGLVANGIFDVTLVQAFLSAIKLNTNK